MLHDILLYCIFAFFDKKKTSSAGEQLVGHKKCMRKKSHFKGNSIQKSFDIFFKPMPTKTHFIFAFCPFYTGAVH